MVPLSAEAAGYRFLLLNTHSTSASTRLADVACRLVRTETLQAPRFNAKPTRLGKAPPPCWVAASADALAVVPKKKVH